MHAGDVLADFAFQMAEKNLNRFTQSDRIRLLNRACKQLAYAIDFPEDTTVYEFTNGSTEFALVELIKILRVYVMTADGQKIILPGTDINELEGDNLQLYDNNGSRVAGYASQSPAWIAQPAVSYPWPNVYTGSAGFNGSNPGGAVGVTGPWRENARPRYYLRGGNIGIVPPPIVQTITDDQGNTTTWPKLAVDIIPAPLIVVSENDLLAFPDSMGDTLVWKMVEYAKRADGDSTANEAAAMFDNLVATQTRPWLAKLQATRPKVFAPITKRSFIPGREIL